MADKLNIQFRIMAIDNFSKTLGRLERKLESIKRQSDGSNFSVVADAMLDTKDFDKDYYQLLENLMDLPDKVDIKLEADGFEKVEAQLQKLERADKQNTYHYNLKAHDKFSKAFDKLDRRILQSKLLLGELNNERVDIESNMNVQDVLKKLADIPKMVNKTQKKVDKKPIYVPIKTEWKEFKRQIDQLADYSRDVGELMQHFLVGSLVSSIPMLVPVIANVGAVLGSLLPIIGTVSGGIMGLGTSFAIAGAGGFAYYKMMEGVLKDVFDASKDLATLNKKLKLAKDDKERAKVMEEIADATALLSDEQKGAVTALNGTKSAWSAVAKNIEPQIIRTFTTAMEALSKVIDRTEPMFMSLATHVENLADWLSIQVDAQDMKDFFTFMNTHAGPALNTLGKAATNFGIGLLSMMEAFGPLSVDMQNGFLRMSEGFRTWAAGLSESDRFKAFIDYVRENLPKLGSIFGNIIGGLTGLGEAFAPFTADMLTGLVDMTQKFEDWGKSMSENQGFKDFIAYVEETGPQLLAFLGELGKFLINLGIAFADVGKFLIKFHTGMLEWYNLIMENHPTLMKIVAAVATLGAIFLTVLPAILLFRNILKMVQPVLNLLWLGIQKVIPMLGRFGGIILRVIPWIMRIGRVIALLTTGPIGLFIGALALVALAVWQNWDKIKKWTSDMKEKLVGLFGELVAKAILKFNEMKDSVMSIVEGIDLFESGKKIIGSVIDGMSSMLGGVIGVTADIAGAIRDYWPFSPAKRGPLSDLDKLNFGGPVIDSLEKDAPRINSAMNRLLVAPQVTADGYGRSSSVYGARSSGYAQQTQQADLAQALAAGISIQSGDIYMSGEKVGKATWRTVDRSTKRDQGRKDRFGGKGTIV